MGLILKGVKGVSLKKTTGLLLGKKIGLLLTLVMLNIIRCHTHS